MRPMMTMNRSVVVDLLVGLATFALASITFVSLITPHTATWLPWVGASGLALMAVGTVLERFLTRPDHLRAVQSQQILNIANESLTYLRQGLTSETAQEVCRIALKQSEAAAVAITDTERILGFAGIGEDHHSVGGPILTQATRDALMSAQHTILESKEEIACERKGCMLRAAIVVPLEMRGLPAGTLKFYYTTPRLLNETQITMAVGLAQLLSTQLELSELEHQTQLATRMELKALQAQINPHFLFNTINTIASLIRTDPPHARDLLREFAVFYRRTLESGEDHVPLERELEYVRRYLVFEKARFGDRIVIREDVDPRLADVEVPAFALQPIVENAIQHGMRAEGPLEVTIRCVCRGSDAIIEVRDNGKGIPADMVHKVLEPGVGKGLGIALKNVDDRLRGYFGQGSGVHVESVEGEGTTVSLTIVGGCAVAGEEGSDAC